MPETIWSSQAALQVHVPNLHAASQCGAVLSTYWELSTIASQQMIQVKSIVNPKIPMHEHHSAHTPSNRHHLSGMLPRVEHTEPGLKRQPEQEWKKLIPEVDTSGNGLYQSGVAAPSSITSLGETH